MTFDHQTSGTCNDARCPLHGLCHCGCGAKTNISRQSRSNRGQTVIRQPQIFRHGHYARWAKVVPPGGPYTRCGELIDVDGVRELVRRWGNMFIVGRYLGVSNAWVSMVLSGKLKRCRSRIAQAIRDGLALEQPPELGAWIPCERVRPMVQFLHERYGSMRAVDRILEMSPDWTTRFLSGRYKRGVRQSTARKIVETVRLHHIPQASRSVWDVERRVPTREERDEARREREAAERRHYRKKAKEDAA